MRTVTIAVVLLLLVPMTLVLSSPEGLEKETSKTLDFSPGERLSIETYKGTIHLTSWERDKIEIQATIEAPREVSAEYGEEIVEATRVDIRRTRSGVSIRSNYEDVRPQRRFFGSYTNRPYVHYEIRAPRSLDLKIDDHKSEIEIYGFEGALKLETHKGTIEGRDLSGELRIETHKGIVKLTSVRGGLELETHKGNIYVEADSIESRTRLNTHKGTIELSLPESQSATVRADLSKRADFRSDFGLDRKKRSRNRFDADLNGGGPEIYVTSHKGDIRLSRRQIKR